MKKVIKSMKWVLFWMCLAILFNLGILAFMGSEKALQFLGGYLIELSLSIDNLFLFVTIFTCFGIAEHARHRVLAYGIAGAVVLRFIFILLGVKIVTHFEWVLYLFGIILIISGIKMFKSKEEEGIPNNSKVIKYLGKIIPITPDFVGEKFFVKRGKILYATPLFAVLVLIEFSDILFAIDSVPAAFSVSTNLFIIYTSNIFAILGLRQLYFVLDHLQERFQYVKYGVAIILTFTGIKLGILYFNIHIPILTSIGFIVGILILSIIISVLLSNRSSNTVKRGVK
ncbi:TerC/Alx family metal homeostasis membrane protein [Anaerovorax odorimutans]|uniref:TerC/Alx family metal homeostasis membrane protein n=1 Tax=Anaerovorax odorimutans TaxID=109327 RepID=UPI0003F9E80D|nr:TerC/Alx family metal homeostasis membrane protein [Anaerovorax odorimutans]